MNPRLPDRARRTKFLRPKDLVLLRTYHRIEDDPRVRIVGLRVEEPFVVYMKAALVLSARSSPARSCFTSSGSSSRPACIRTSKSTCTSFCRSASGLFLAGAALAFFVVFRFVLAFLLSFYDWMGIDPDPRITDWLTFVLILPLGFGISFQLPLVMLFLERIGIFTVKTYLSNWRISVLVICFLAMVLTPSDPYSMMLMATPLVGLFFFGVLLCKWMPRRTTPFGEADRVSWPVRTTRLESAQMRLATRRKPRPQTDLDVCSDVGEIGRDRCVASAHSRRFNSLRPGQQRLQLLSSSRQPMRSGDAGGDADTPSTGIVSRQACGKDNCDVSWIEDLQPLHFARRLET